MRRSKGKYPHIEFLELEKDVAKECAIIKEYSNGDIAFMDLSELDDIDKTRLLSIIRTEHASQFPLWKLMSNTTLGNGVNALEYFHQLTKVRLNNGRIVSTHSGLIGLGTVDQAVAQEATVKTGRASKATPASTTQSE